MIRHMEPGEEYKVRRLIAQLSYEDQILWRKQTKSLEEYLEEYSKMPVSKEIEGKNAIFVAEKDSKIIGLCWCTIVDRGVDRQGEIAEFYVEGEYRRKGIGKELIKVAKQFFSNEKAEVAFVWTHHGNEAAIRLFRNVGFKEVTQLVMAFKPTDKTSE